MTQTISINLGGLLFHIDDEAYEVLRLYIKAIEKQFVEEREKRDIVQDIENRLAELFSEKLDRQKDLIGVDDVNSVIKIMGEPHDFVDDETTNNSTEKDFKAQTSKRMYRNPDDRILGGVCSGLGVYFNIDIWIFRVIFIVSSIFAFAGIVIYLVLWIAIPDAKTSAQKLEMRGEPITVENIKNTVKSEFENVRRNMNL